MNKPYFALQPSESVLIHAAATIYAGHSSGGRVESGNEQAWLLRSVQEAVTLARLINENVRSDGEMGTI